jgi:hypothetical protein
VRLRVISSHSAVPVTRFTRTKTRLIQPSDMSYFIVTVHELRVTSVQKRIESQRSFSGASGDMTDAHDTPSDNLVIERPIALITGHPQTCQPAPGPRDTGRLVRKPLQPTSPC